MGSWPYAYAPASRKMCQCCCPPRLCVTSRTQDIISIQLCGIAAQQPQRNCLANATLVNLDAARLYVHRGFRIQYLFFCIGCHVKRRFYVSMKYSL